MHRNAIGAWVLQGLLAGAFLAAGWRRGLVLTHFLVLHTSATPAVILLALNALVVWLRHDQLAWAAQRNENA